MKFKDKFKYFDDSRFDHRQGFDGATDSPEYAIFLAHRMVRSHYRNSDVTEIAAMVAQMAEYILDFEVDFKKTVAGTCAPDEKHCSCVPHLRRAYHELSSQVVQTFAPHLGFPRAPDENGNEDPNAPYVVDPFVAEDIIDLVDRSLTSIVELAQQFDDGSLGDEKYSPLTRTAYFLQVAAIRLNPSWSSEIPTAPGNYWFYGTTAYERKNYSPMKPLTKMVFRDEDGFYCNGDYVDPEEHNWIGKWLKFTRPTPEIDNENG